MVNMVQFYKHNIDLKIFLLVLLHSHFMRVIASSDLKFCSNMLNFLNNTDQIDKFVMNIISKPWEGKSSSLSCCLPNKGYDNITWLFNDTDLKISDSTFRVAELDPRYIVSKNVSMNDKGKYTCVAAFSKEDSNKIIKASTKMYHISLHDHEKGYQGQPEEIFIPKDRKPNPGDKNVSFVFGAMIGNLPSLLHQTLIYWELDYNITESYEGKEKGSGHKITLNCSENGRLESFQLSPNCSVVEKGGYKSTQPAPWTHPFKDFIIRTYLDFVGGQVLAYSSLTIPEVTSAMLDSKLNITCVFESTNSRPPLRMIADLRRRDFNTWIVVYGLLSTFLSLMMIVLIGLKYHVEIRLYWKDTFGSIEGMYEHDVYLCFSSTDTHGLVEATLAPYLEDKLGYSCYYIERNALIGEYLPATQPKNVQASRRFVMVLSAEMLQDPICKETCVTALNEALARKLTIVCVQPPKKERKALLTKIKLTDSLETILSVSRKVTWPGQNASPRRMRRFWNELRLRLPPLRKRTVSSPS